MAPPIQRSSRTAKCPNCSSHVHSNSSQDNCLNKAKKNTTSSHPYPSQMKHRNLTSQSRARVTNALQHLSSRQSSTELGSRKKHAKAGDRLSIKDRNAWSVHALTSPKTLLLQQMENKSNTNTPSTVSNQITSLPLLVPGSAEEDGQIRASIAVSGYEAIDGNISRYSTTSDFIKAEGRLIVPESSQIMSIIVCNNNTWFIAHSPRSPDTRSTRRIATHTSTHLLWQYTHLHVSTTSPYTGITPWSSTHHNSQPWQSGDRASEGEPQNSDDSQIYGSFSPGPWTGGAGHPNEGI